MHKLRKKDKGYPKYLEFLIPTHRYKLINQYMEECRDITNISLSISSLKKKLCHWSANGVFVFFLANTTLQSEVE